ncbi:hypothetical protein LV79_003713, partial [Actinokineospora globicatena]|uniref:phage tail protein n=1 Tax=Actinokineospora globicatena TaxID=103729 RepID=UPI003FD8B898|nr:hypothetical protein [Actinokineospora globicatena]
AQVTATLQKVFDATKTDVEAILSGLDKKVDDAFTAGEKAARDAFTAEHKQRMDAYKDKRYSGVTGKLKWVKDKFAGLPEEANQIFVAARQGYVTRMRGVISTVADVIGAELTRAKTRIATGRDQLQAEVRKLPADLQAMGKQAAGEFAGRFDELTESVDAKGSELVQTLATKYNQALKAVDAEIDAEKEKNKGLVAKAIGAIKGVIDTIMQLKDLLLGILAKAAAAVMGILRDPIGFLGNLVSAVGSGLRAFMANIGEHLKKGLVGWLMGAMAGAGLQLPAKFDPRGILMMIASLLGLTWSAIRGRIVARGVPEPAMAAAEGAVPAAQKLKSEGVGGLWETAKDKVGDLKAGLFGKIAQYLVPTVLVAGITWIISLLNPASAFIKAVKMIVDIVTFIVTQGAQIIQFVNAVLDAVVTIASGGAGGVPGLIELALATSIPVLIGALAAILGVSGIADKVKKIIQSLAKPVMKVVDRIVDKIAGVAKKLWAKLKGKVGKKAAPATPEERRKHLSAGIAALERVSTKYQAGATEEQMTRELRSVKRGHPVFKELSATKRGDHWEYRYVASPPTTKGGPPTSGSSFSLPPGPLANYEGHVILTAAKPKDIHLIGKHGEKFTDVMMKDRLNSFVAEFRRLRADKVAYQRNVVAAATTRLARLQGDPVGNAARIQSTQDAINAANKLITDYNAISDTDRDAVFDMLDKWSKSLSGMASKMVTRFTDDNKIEPLARAAIAANQAAIDAAFTEANGDPKPNGTQKAITHPAPPGLGAGFEMDATNTPVEITRVLSKVVFRLIVSDAANRHFLIETGYFE